MIDVKIERNWQFKQAIVESNSSLGSVWMLSNMNDVYHNTTGNVVTKVAIDTVDDLVNDMTRDGIYAEVK